MRWKKRDRMYLVLRDNRSLRQDVEWSGYGSQFQQEPVAMLLADCLIMLRLLHPRTLNVVVFPHLVVPVSFCRLAGLASK